MRSSLCLFFHISLQLITDCQKEHGQHIIDESDQEDYPTVLQTEPTSHRKMHQVPQHRQQQGETLLDFIDHLIEKIIDSKE